MSADSPFDVALGSLPELQGEAHKLRAEFDERVAAGDVAAPADLLLALACANRLPAGLALFEARVIPAVRASVRRLPNADVDEVLQRFRERLLVGGKLRSYDGRGSFEGWCRAVAVRLALEHRPAAATEVLDESLPGTERSVELSYLLSAHRAQFREAFRVAFAELSPRDRAVLRLSAVEGVSLDAIGRQHGVNKSTVSRWLTAARAQVLARVRAQLSESVTRDPRELDSLLTQLGGQLSISLSMLD